MNKSKEFKEKHSSVRDRSHKGYKDKEYNMKNNQRENVEKMK